MPSKEMYFIKEVLQARDLASYILMINNSDSKVVETVLKMALTCFLLSSRKIAKKLEAVSLKILPLENNTFALTLNSFF